MNTRILLSILLLCSLAILFTSCETEPSDAVDQDRIFTDYELFYNANDDKTYARATFRFGNIAGTLLELTDPSQVTFNGDLLTFKSLLGYYEREYAGLVSSGTFQWMDIDGNTFNNTIEIRTADYADSPDTIDRSAAFELEWSGDPLGEKENVTVVVNGENELDAQTFFTNNIGVNSIILDRDKLLKLGQGPGTVFLDRRYQPGLVEATSAGGMITGRYRPENLTPFLK